jgi:hypothetical protein
MSHHHRQQDIDAGLPSTQWVNQHNYVAKVYLEDPGLQEALRLFKHDLVMQVRAKQLAFEYNALNPPKKITMVNLPKELSSLERVVKRECRFMCTLHAYYL